MTPDQRYGRPTERSSPSHPPVSRVVGSRRTNRRNGGRTRWRLARCASLIEAQPAERFLACQDDDKVIELDLTFDNGDFPAGTAYLSYGTDKVD